MWNLEPSVLRSEGNGCLWTLKPIRESTLLTDLNFELHQYTLFLNLFFVVWKDTASLFLILLCNKMKFAFNLYLIVQEFKSARVCAHFGQEIVSKKQNLALR